MTFGCQYQKKNKGFLFPDSFPPVKAASEAHGDSSTLLQQEVSKWLCCFSSAASSGENHERDSAFCPLKDGNRLFVGYPF